MAALGAVFTERSDLVRSLAATVLVAAVFQPLRTRLQLAVDRLLYEDRSRPYDAVTRLGERLETAGAPEAALPGVVKRSLRHCACPTSRSCSGPVRSGLGAGGELRRTRR